MNILITSAGRRVSLVKAFQQELKKINVNACVYTVDLNPNLSSACNVSDGFFKVPRVTDDTYISVLLDICKEYSVSVIVPTIDTELLVLSNNISLFKENGISIIISNTDFIKKCRDKRLIHNFFEEKNINFAKEMDKSDLSFPLFAKPYDGSCSVDTFFIENESQLSNSILSNEKLMFLEYINHDTYDEYTVDMYYDRNSELKIAVPRRRIEIRSGEVNKGITEKNAICDLVWSNLKKVEGLRGCITLQVFFNVNTKHIVGIEINPRFGGGYPLSYLAGANFPKCIIEEYMLGHKVNVFNDWEDQLLMLRYDSEVLVHANI